MSEKKVKFEEDSLADQFENDDDEATSRLKKGKHSLDSDEDDDDGDKYDVMKEDDIEGLYRQSLSQTSQLLLAKESSVLHGHQYISDYPLFEDKWKGDP